MQFYLLKAWKSPAAFPAATQETTAMILQAGCGMNCA